MKTSWCIQWERRRTEIFNMATTKFCHGRCVLVGTFIRLDHLLLLLNPEFINETALTLYPKFGGGHGCIQLSLQLGFFSVINWQIPSRNSGLQAQEHCRPDQTKMSGYLLPSIWWVLSVYLTGRNSHGDCLTISVSVRRALYKVVVKFIYCLQKIIVFKTWRRSDR